MKTTTKLCIAAALFCGAKLFAGDTLPPIDWQQVEPVNMAKAEPAGEPAPAEAPAPKQAKARTDWWTDFSITPFGSISHPGFGAPVYGVGLDLGYSINRAVSIHVSTLTLDSENWGGTAIDENSLLLRADLIRTGGSGKDRIVFYALGGADVAWAQDGGAPDKAFGAGLGAELRLTKNLSLGIDSRIRAWFDSDKDVITRGFASFRF